MRKDIIDIKAESLPWYVKLLGGMFLFAAFFLATDYWWLAIGLAVVGLALLTWYNGTEIDTEKGRFREYNSCLFIRRGTAEKYNNVEKVFINKANISQTMYTAHTSSSSTFENIVFNAYLKFDDGRKIFLTSRKDKIKLIELLDPLVTLLAVDLIDNTI
jgi:hypothetical protein